MKKIYVILAVFILMLLTRCQTESNIELSEKTIENSESKIFSQISIEESNIKAEEIPSIEITEISSQEEYNQSIVPLNLHFLNVGQADSAFIELPDGQTVLIDAGNSQDAHTIINYIKDLEYNKIDYVIATHPHSDHIGGMAKILENFEIGKMYMPKQVHTTVTFENMLNVIQNQNIDLYTAKAGVNILTTINTKIDILAPFQDNYSNLNNSSVVIKLMYGDTVMLFMGDAEEEIESQLLAYDINADLIKIGHHGSDSSSSKNFLSKVSPDIAIISCGMGNSYGHPHDSTLSTLFSMGIETYRTDELGTIKVSADPHKKLTINKKASSVKEQAPPIIEETSETIDEIKGENTVAGSTNTIVYKTNSGKKYHRDGCSYLKSKIETTVSEAKSIGLTPCSRCSPPE